MLSKNCVISPLGGERLQNGRTDVTNQVHNRYDGREGTVPVVFTAPKNDSGEN